MSLKSTDFFLEGTHEQFVWVLAKYQDALRAKAEAKNSKPENLVKLDKWYHTDLPKKIKSRGKEAHLTHEEIVQCMKWKLATGKYSQKLKDLIQMNTPRVVIADTKKAFRALAKRDDLEAAMSVLCTLKGVGPAFASAVLAAFQPERVPYMSDEALLSMPDCDEVEYTMKEYNKMLEELNKCQERLNSQGGHWGLHSIDKALLSYHVLREHKPEILKDMPEVTEVRRREITQEEQEVSVETIGAKCGNGQITPDTKEPLKSSSVMKRSLDDVDQDSQDSEAKRPRGDGEAETEAPEASEAESPHKANLSGQLLVC